jgi:hypothetical protein
MSERERVHDHYWQDDVTIGEGLIGRSPHTIRMRVHSAREHFRHHHELLSLSVAAGERIYVHAKPYILVPDITLSVGLYERPTTTGAIGEVTGSDWTGMRHEEIGQMQAWYYPNPNDRLVMLWECYAEERYRALDPRDDATLAVLWSGFERWLIHRFPEAERLATTWEDLYPRSAWHAFLADQGYQQVAPAAFAKPTWRPNSADPPQSR